MLYHQSQQVEKSHRTTALDKIEDKFDYGAMTFPTSLENIQQIEDDNRLTINIFCMSGET
jgi:hypothetical protein